MECTCKKCGMGVKGMTCAKCNAELVADTKTKNNETLNIAKCPKGCGEVIAPSCCHQEMACE